jgi:hypothetical protein
MDSPDAAINPAQLSAWSDMPYLTQSMTIHGLIQPLCPNLSLLAGEVDCIWQIFRALAVRDSVGLPLQVEQAQTPGQLVTFVIGLKFLSPPVLK